MKKTIYIIFFLLFLVSLRYEKAMSQNETYATVYLRDIVLTQPNELEFDLRLMRNSDKWLYWANGSFEFTFDSTGYKVDPNNLTIEAIQNTSDLDISPITGQLPTDNYLLTPRIFDGRISVTVAGPENFGNTVKVPGDTVGVRIARFKMKTKDGSIIPQRLMWLQPFYYYQACAFKLDRDSMIVPSVYLNYTDNNIEMDNELLPKVEYRVDPGPQPLTDIINFQAIYIGQKKVKLLWETRSESMVKGWMVARSKRDFMKEMAPEQLNYADTVADYRRGVPPHDGIVGLGTKKPGRKYEFIADSVPARGISYCYELQYQDFFGKLHTKLAYACVDVPNGVVTFAQNDPNPFTGKTYITYTVDDDVYLSVMAYDLRGKLIEKLMDNVFVKLGRHEKEIVFDVSDLAQQGLYNIILIAYPINDTSVEISKAVIKAQLIR